MQLFFQSFLATTKAIKSFIKERKKVKITLVEDSLSFLVVTALTKGEIESSCKNFFLFIQKHASELDLKNLVMGERIALIEVVSVLELYLGFFLPTNSAVREHLEEEVFSFKLGSLIPRSYIEKNSADVRFIKNNSLERIIFHHGEQLAFDKKMG